MQGCRLHLGLVAQQHVCAAAGREPQLRRLSGKVAADALVKHDLWWWNSSGVIMQSERVHMLPQGCQQCCAMRCVHARHVRQQHIARTCIGSFVQPLLSCRVASAHSWQGTAPKCSAGLPIARVAAWPQPLTGSRLV